MPEHHVQHTKDEHGRQIVFAEKRDGSVVVVSVYNPHTNRESRRLVNGCEIPLTTPERGRLNPHGLVIFGRSIHECPNVAALPQYAYALYNPRAIQDAIQRAIQDKRCKMAEQTEDEKQKLANLVRNWRYANDFNIGQLAILLGISPRTLEGIEQGRGFRYHKTLTLALLALEMSMKKRRR